MDSVLESGHRHYDERRYGFAVAAFSKILQQEPEHAEARFGRALALRDDGQTEAAVADLEMLLADERNPEQLALAHRLRGQIHFAEGAFPRAIWHHRRCQQLDSDFWDNLADLGDSWLFQGHPAKALRCYQVAFRDLSHAHWQDFLWHRAAAHLALGQTRAVARDCRNYRAMHGWGAELSAYTAVYEALAEPAQSGILLEQCPPGWPRPVLEFLAGRRSADEVHRAAAPHELWRTEAQLYLGLAAPDERPRLKELAARPLDPTFELALARIALRRRVWPRPTRLERWRAWLWQADQAQLDEAARHLARLPGASQAPLLALALELEARPPGCRALIEAADDSTDPMALVVILCADPELRRQAGGPRARGFSDPWLQRLVAVPDREPLTVVDPTHGLAARVEVSGVADIFQLHVLLADLLVGLGWPGVRPLPEVAAIFRGQGYQRHPFELAQGCWNLYRPEAVDLPMFLEGEDATRHWIWNEGQFADIPFFEGERTLLVGPPAAVRTFTAARLFERLPASVTLLETIDAGALLEKLRSARSV